MNKLQIGDIVKSKQNIVYEGTWTVTKVYKTTVWVKVNDKIGKTYKGIRPSILYKIGTESQPSLLK